MPNEDVEIKSGSRFLPHIALQVFNTPLMISPQKLDVIVRVLGERIGLEGGEIQASEMAKARAPVTTGRVEIAVIPIIGSLVHRRAGMEALSGLRSYEGIREDFHRAEGDSKVDAILLDIDSHGGSSAGIFDLGDEIHNSKKPVYAYVNEMAYSAGYLLASSAKQVFLPRTGGVGSIGVRMVHVDQSEFNKKMGVKVTNLFVGERKVDFDPHSPLSKEAQESAMKELKDIYGLFADTAARNRGLNVQTVKGTEAACYMGQHAVDIGLADKVMNFDEVIDFIVEDVRTAGKTTSTARGARNKEVESAMFKTLAEFKTENPEMFTQFRMEVERDLRASFDAKQQGFEAQISGLKGELQERDKMIKDQDARILKLEKTDYIRAEQEKKVRIDAAVDRVWTKALAACDVPEEMHERVRKCVPSASFIKEGALDEAAYQAAVHAEIAEWEGMGMTTNILGTGFAGGKSGEDLNVEAKTEKKLAEEDDAWVSNMLKLGGQKKEEGGDE
ncbi:MAG: S49 family peptidase [Desulfobacteraceae bacterium]|nr:MAG: S49 family peptidase [Desulfobacteraceae bacterium]